jgi:hypothetical protein
MGCKVVERVMVEDQRIAYVILLYKFTGEAENEAA